MKVRTGKALRAALITILILGAAGCTHNPLLGKWSIKSRDREAEATFVDQLTSILKKSSGATTVEFRKDSILVSGGPQDHTVNGVSYIIQELEGGATTVQIMQPRKSDPDNNDVDVCHVDPTGNSAQLESRNTVIQLTRAGD
jgi:hypothetical protein